MLLISVNRRLFVCFLLLFLLFFVSGCEMIAGERKAPTPKAKVPSCEVELFVNNLLSFSEELTSNQIIKSAKKFNCLEFAKPLPVIRTEHGLSTCCVSLGDLNDDTAYNVLDVVILVNMVLDDYQLGDYCSPDMNHDDEINILDIVSLVNCVVASDGACEDKVTPCHGTLGFCSPDAASVCTTVTKVWDVIPTRQNCESDSDCPDLESGSFCADCFPDEEEGGVSDAVRSLALDEWDCLCDESSGIDWVPGTSGCFMTCGNDGSTFLDIKFDDDDFEHGELWKINYDLNGGSCDFNGGWIGVQNKACCSFCGDGVIFGSEEDCDPGFANTARGNLSDANVWSTDYDSVELGGLGCSSEEVINTLTNYSGCIDNGFDTPCTAGGDLGCTTGCGFDISSCSLYPNALCEYPEVADASGDFYLDCPFCGDTIGDGCQAADNENITTCPQDCCDDDGTSILDMICYSGCSAVANNFMMTCDGLSFDEWVCYDQGDGSNPNSKAQCCNQTTEPTRCTGCVDNIGGGVSCLEWNLTFSNQGISFQNDWDILYDSQGDILIGFEIPDFSNVSVEKYTVEGFLDTSFGTDGILYFEPVDFPFYSDIDVYYNGVDFDSVIEVPDTGYAFLSFYMSVNSTEESQYLWLKHTNYEGTTIWDSVYQLDGDSYIFDGIDLVYDEEWGSGFVILSRIKNDTDGEYSTWVIKTDSDGNTCEFVNGECYEGVNRWARVFKYENYLADNELEAMHPDYSSGDRPLALAKTSDDGYVVAGRITGFGLSDDLVFILELNLTGGIEDFSVINLFENEIRETAVPTFVLENDDGDYYVGGKAQNGNFDTIFVVPFVMKFNSSSGVSRVVTNPTNTQSAWIDGVLSEDGDLVIIGRFESSDDNPQLSTILLYNDSTFFDESKEHDDIRIWSQDYVDELFVSMEKSDHGYVISGYNMLTFNSTLMQVGPDGILD